MGYLLRLQCNVMNYIIRYHLKSVSNNNCLALADRSTLIILGIYLDDGSNILGLTANVLGSSECCIIH